MGTQKSSGGPKKPFPLLPPWAGDGGAPPAVAGPNGAGDNGANAQPGGDGAPPTADGQPASSAADTPLAIPRMGNLRSAKVAMGKFARGGGGGGVRGAGRAYVRGRGGAGGAARSAVGGRASTARLGRFLSTVANTGWREAARALGLARLVGQPAEAACAALLDVLAPSGATLEDAAARKAVNEALWELYDRFDLQDGDLRTLDRLDRETVAELVEVSVVTYIYTRWLQELGERLESKALGDAELVRLEGQVKEYVKDTVKLDLAKNDVLRIDWEGAEGRRLVERIYQEAYSFLEEE
jgi:hypothetical protein